MGVIPTSDRQTMGYILPRSPKLLVISVLGVSRAGVREHSRMALQVSMF